MDLLPSIDELRDELMAHDLAVQEIIALDQYIERQSEETFISNMSESEAPPFQRLIRIATAEGVKRMFKEYRLQKWLKVQEMADTVRRVLNAVAPPEEEENQLPWQQPSVAPVPYSVPAGSERPMVGPEWQPSPVPGPLIRLLSPIVTPQVPANTEPRHIQTFHSSPHIINRQLFPDSQCPNNGEEYQDTVLYQSNIAVGVHPPVGVQPAVDPIHTVHTEEQPSINTFQSNGINNVTTRGFPDHPISTHAVVPTIENIPPVHQGYPVNIDHPVYVNDIDDEMDWDSDYDSSYDDSEENLAGVLFATQSLLPDEQAVRLDVEMGDMGVGHIMFDRVSAAWCKYQCVFNRAG